MRQGRRRDRHEGLHLDARSGGRPHRRLDGDVIGRGSSRWPRRPSRGAADGRAGTISAVRLAAMMPASRAAAMASPLSRPPARIRATVSGRASEPGRGPRRAERDRLAADVDHPDVGGMLGLIRVSIAARSPVSSETGSEHGRGFGPGARFLRNRVRARPGDFGFGARFLRNRVGAWPGIWFRSPRFSETGSEHGRGFGFRSPVSPKPDQLAARGFGWAEGGGNGFRLPEAGHSPMARSPPARAGGLLLENFGYWRCGLRRRRAMTATAAASPSPSPAGSGTAAMPPATLVGAAGK